jgi:L-fuconolactonase
VGWVPLIAPEVGDILAQLAGDRNLKAVSHVLHDEPDDDYMLRNDFNRGIGRLQAHELVYDVLIFPRHLENAIRFADRYPSSMPLERTDCCSAPTGQSAFFAVVMESGWRACVT